MSVTRASGSLAMRLWTGYTRQLEQKPMLTKSFTSFFGFIAGDSIAQLSMGEKYDYWRTARFAAYGFCIHAPVCHAWYGVLDRSVMPGAPTSPKAVVAKMAIDQLLFTPFATGVFYAIIKTMEGQPDRIVSTLREKFVPTLLAGYTVWPLAHLINFRYISGQQRILYINVVSIAWNVILCRIAGGDSSARTAPRVRPAGKPDRLESRESRRLEGRESKPLKAEV